MSYLNTSQITKQIYEWVDEVETITVIKLCIFTIRSPHFLSEQCPIITMEWLDVIILTCVSFYFLLLKMI